MIKTIQGIPIKNITVPDIEVVVEFRTKCLPQDRQVAINLGSFTADTKFNKGLSEGDFNKILLEFKRALSSGIGTCFIKASNCQENTCNR